MPGSVIVVLSSDDDVVGLDEVTRSMSGLGVDVTAAAGVRRELGELESELSVAEKGVAVLRRRRRQLVQRLKKIDSGAGESMRVVERSIMRDVKSVDRMVSQRRRQEERRRPEGGLLRFFGSVPRPAAGCGRRTVCGFRMFEVESCRTRLAPLARTPQPARIEAIGKGNRKKSFLDEIAERAVAAKSLTSPNTYPLEAAANAAANAVTNAGDDDSPENTIRSVNNDLGTAPRRVKYISMDPGAALRPPWFGTWSRTSAVVTGRRPLAMDKMNIDYDVDSEDEWQEENGSGDECSSSNGSNEDEDPADYEDGGFLVPDTYNSDENAEENGGDENAEEKVLSAAQRWMLMRKKQDKKRMKPVSLGVFIAGTENYERAFKRLEKYTIFHPQYMATGNENKPAATSSPNKKVSKRKSKAVQPALPKPSPTPTIKDASPSKKRRKIACVRVEEKPDK